MDQEVIEEIDRQFADKVSFVFVLKWLQNKSNRSKLLTHLLGDAKG